jgi:hypothetical protein
MNRVNREEQMIEWSTASDAHLDMDRLEFVPMNQADRDYISENFCSLKEHRMVKWMVHRWRHKNSGDEGWVISLDALTEDNCADFRLSLMIFGPATDRRFENIKRKTVEKGFFNTSYRYY